MRLLLVVIGGGVWCSLLTRWPSSCLSWAAWLREVSSLSAVLGDKIRRKTYGFGTPCFAMKSEGKTVRFIKRTVLVTYQWLLARGIGLDKPGLL